MRWFFVNIPTLAHDGPAFENFAVIEKGYESEKVGACYEPSNARPAYSDL